MEPVILLHLFILTVILVSIGQLFVMVRYLVWPPLRRITHCPWCWRDAGITGEFPAPWSSTMCPYHAHQIRLQSRRHRVIGKGSSSLSTASAAVLLQVKDRESERYHEIAE